MGRNKVKRANLGVFDWVCYFVLLCGMLTISSLLSTIIVEKFCLVSWLVYPLAIGITGVAFGFAYALRIRWMEFLKRIKRG